MRSKLEELESRKAELERVVANAVAPLPRLHPNHAELYRQKVADLQQALAAPDTRTEALEILRGLIERIVLHPIDRGFEVELVGEIAAMANLGAQNQKAAPGGAAVPDPYRCSVKVVAEARNQRYLQIVKARVPNIYAY